MLVFKHSQELVHVASLLSSRSVSILNLLYICPILLGPSNVFGILLVLSQVYI